MKPPATPAVSALRLLRLVAALPLLSVALPAAPSTDLATRQSELNTQVAELADAYRGLLAELRSLGASRQDLASLEGALSTLSRLNTDDIPRIVELLKTSDLPAALAAQKTAAGQLRDLSVQLQQRQQEIILARQARELAVRQAANRRRTDALRLGATAEGARAFALAEQDALLAESLALVDQLQRLLQDPSRPPSPALQRAAPAADLEALRGDAARAAERTRALDYQPALASQLLVQDRLLRLATLGRAALPPAEAARLALQETEALLAEQQTLRDKANTAGTDPADLGWAQDKLTARADTLRPDVEALAAPAGHALREAADAMHTSRLKFSKVRDTRVLPEQDTALARLGTTRDLLRALIEKATPPRAADAKELQRLARDAAALQTAQEKLNDRAAKARETDANARAAIDQEQAALARQTAALQEAAQANASEAASELGQAASLMTESTDQAKNNLTAADAAAQAAADHLAAAARQLAADATAAAQQQAAAQLASADARLQDAQAKLDEATQAASTAAAAQAAQEAAAALQQARDALAQSAGQGAPQDADSRKALSEAWNAVNEAAQKTSEGKIAAAQDSAKRAAEALKKVTPPGEQSAAGEGGMDNGHVENHGEKASEKIGVAGLTQADREAISAARRQPVPAAYSGLVEAYYDALNETER